VQPVAQVRGVRRRHGLVRPPRRRAAAAASAAAAWGEETHAPERVSLAYPRIAPLCSALIPFQSNRLWHEP
jgi:hypothetical protein